MKKLAAIGLLAGTVVAVAGCAGSGGRHAQGSVRTSLAVRVSPRAWRRVKLAGVGAGFISPTRLAFLTSGSGSCPSVPYRLTVQSPDSIRVDLKIAAPAAKNGVCTADLVMSPVAIAIDPSQIDVHRPLRVALHYPTSKGAVVFTAPALY